MNFKQEIFEQYIGLEKNEKLDNSEEWIKTLEEIFEKQSLFENELKLEGANILGDRILYDISKAFENAADDLVELFKHNEDYWNNKHLRYAKLYCKERANLARHKYNNSVVYYIDKLGTEGLSILKAFPDYKVVWYRLVYVYKLNETMPRECVDSASNIIANRNKMTDRQISDAYHFQSLMCDGRGISEIDVLKLSKKAYEEDITNYKAVKKYISMLKDTKKKVEIVLNSLKTLENKQVLTPNEIYYLFNFEELLGYYYNELKEPSKSIICARNALNIREQFLKGEYILSDKKYTKATRCLFNLRWCYQSIAMSLHDIGLYEEADEYWRLYREWS